MKINRFQWTKYKLLHLNPVILWPTVKQIANLRSLNDDDMNTRHFLYFFFLFIFTTFFNNVFLIIISLFPHNSIMIILFSFGLYFLLEKNLSSMKNSSKNNGGGIQAACVQTMWFTPVSGPCIHRLELNYFLRGVRLSWNRRDPLTAANLLSTIHTGRPFH